jgi:endonuclease/exonuclease/phosphatase family metal-dependent hydrolase
MRQLFLTAMLCTLGACQPALSGGSPEASHDDRPQLTLGCWNLQWFGSPSEGPADDALQLATVRDVIHETDVDIWALVEIADAGQFQRLLAELPEYEGVLASSDAPGGQGLGFLYKTSVAGLRSATAILTSYEYEFAGRPPLEAMLETEADELVVIALHAKAFDDLSSWQRRQSASLALKAYLDASYPTQKVAVLGDYNDDVDVSIASGLASPYENFVVDRTHYAFPTAALSAAGDSSTLYNSDMVDHHLVSNELLATFIDGSAEVLDVADYSASQASAASDHYPVVSRYER